ncbi:MAG TPA: hypothetical protein VK468_03275, partial [Pyrinomonadaceae bacterium]|nr:hypothetical protein [Pyrinomonadaceae bacterium]
NQSPFFARWRQTVWTGSTSPDWHTAANWGGGTVPLPNAGISIVSSDVSITSADVTVNSLIVSGGRTVTIGAGRTLTVTRTLDLSDGSLAGPGTLIVNGDFSVNAGNVTGLASVTVNGSLYLTNGIISGSGPVAVTSCRTSAIGGGSAGSYVSSPLTRCVNSAGTYRFPVGSSGVYAPVELAGITGSGNFTVEPKSGEYAGATGLPANRLQRWWNMAGSGISQADLTFSYSDTEVVGIEGRYRAYSIAGGTAQQVPTVLNLASNKAFVAGATSFAAWTLAEAAPTFETLKGRITTPSSMGADRVIVTLTDQLGNVRYGISSQLGYYRFMNVETWKTYTIQLVSKKYVFTPAARTLEFIESAPDVNFRSANH